jgi:hypothetical protein
MTIRASARHSPTFSAFASPAPVRVVGDPAGQGETPRDVSNDIWASDLHLTPDGKFLYAAERTSITLGAFSVDAATGTLTYLSSTPVEKQPRGFRIHPKGTYKYMVVSGELSDTISVYAIPANGALALLNKYPTGKDSKWVEIVSFDQDERISRCDICERKTKRRPGVSARAVGTGPPLTSRRFRTCRPRAES